MAMQAMPLSFHDKGLLCALDCLSAAWVLVVRHCVLRAPHFFFCRESRSPRSSGVAIYKLCSDRKWPPDPGSVGSTLR